MRRRFFFLPKQLYGWLDKLISMSLKKYKKNVEVHGLQKNHLYHDLSFKKRYKVFSKKQM